MNVAQVTLFLPLSYFSPISLKIRCYIFSDAIIFSAIEIKSASVKRFDNILLLSPRSLRNNW